MAQERRVSPMRRLRVLAKRFGIASKREIGVAAVVLVLIVGAVGACGVVDVRQGFEVERMEKGGKEDSAERDADDKGRASEQSSSGSNDANDAKRTQETPQRMFVHVDGAVVNPGVYVFDAQDVRINDVVLRAGGLTGEADTSSVNLAAPIADGQKIHIPAVGEVILDAHAQGPSSDAPSSSAPTDAGKQSALVNINVASAEELTSLTGIGEATAAAIVEEREANGPFSAPEDLMRVSGIGEKKFAKVKDHICV